MDAGDPVISVDAKKKEHVGPFKKGGAPGRSQTTRSTNTTSGKPAPPRTT